MKEKRLRGDDRVNARARELAHDLARIAGRAPAKTDDRVGKQTYVTRMEAAEAAMPAPTPEEALWQCRAQAFDEVIRVALAMPEAARLAAHAPTMTAVTERRAATLYRRATEDGAVDGAHDHGPAVEAALARAGSGHALPAELRARFERELGMSLATVRIHTDALAAEAAHAVRAHAFTVGEDIFFAAGAFAPDSRDGRALLAHELAHVVQAWQGRTDTRGGGVSRAGDTLEREADEVAERVVARIETSSTAAQAIARAPAPAVAPAPRAQLLRKGFEYTKSAGADIVPEGTSGWVVVRIGWLVEQGAAIGQKVFELSANAGRVFLERLRDAGFWWMPAAALVAPRLTFNGPLERGKDAVRMSLANTIYEVIGLPPNTKFDWLIRGTGGALELLQSDQLDVKPDGDAVSVTVPDAVKLASLRSIFERTQTPVRPDLAPAMWGDPTGTYNPARAAVGFERSPEFLAALLGMDAETAKAKLAHTPDTDTSTLEGVKFAPSIAIEDRQFYLDWLKRTYGAIPTGAGAPPYPGLIEELKKIDNSPARDQILAAIKQSSPDGKALDWAALDRLIYDVEQEKDGADVGMKAPTVVHDRPHARRFERPITGEIQNLGSLASPGKELELVFVPADPMDLGMPWITTRWIATPLNAPASHVKEGATRHLAFHPPKAWKVTFDYVGVFNITAFVDHDQYWPAHFETQIEVKPEEERLDQVEGEAYTDIGKETDRKNPAEGNHFFSVSFTNDRFGSDKNTFGKVYKGDVPKGFAHRSIADRMKFLADDRAQLEDLIKAYTGAAKAGDRQAKDVLDYAEHALETLDDSRAKVDDDAKDLKPFEMRGAFLSDKNGVKSGTMTLVALAGKRDHVGNAGVLVTVDKHKPTVRIHDFSQLYENKNALYTGTGDDFRAAVEDAFVAMCKSYPAGRVSVMFEDLDESFLPTGKTLGFELHSNTAWKSFKSTVWDSKVQLAVNLIAAAAAVFVPGLAPVAMLLITAYNTVDVVDNLQVLANKGQATWKDGVEAAVMIGMNFLPFAGKLTKAGELAGVALFAVDALSVTTNVVVMTEQGMRQVAELRDGDIKEIATLQADIAKRKATNDSDPEIPVKQAELDAKIKEAQGRSKEVFTEMAKSGAVMMLTPVVFNHMLNGIGRLRTANLEESGLFHHVAGVEPHYDPATQRVVGDRAKVTEAKLAAIKERYFLDMYRQHAEVGRLLGVRAEEVAIQYKKEATKITVERNADGIWEVTAPEGTPPDKIRDEVWAQKGKSSSAPTDRPAVRPAADYGGVMDPAVVAKIDGKTIVVGDRIASRAEAEAMLHGLAEGDPATLKKLLGGKQPPKGFDPRTTEWGLGRLPDGQYVVLRGEHGAVDWEPFPDLVPIGHSHPLRSRQMLASDGGAAGIRVTDLVGKGQVNRENRVKFFPSGADIGFAARERLPQHSVYTPYVHAGNGVIGNPVGDWANLPNIDWEINHAQRVGSFMGNDEIPIYKADLVARDRNGKVVWEGEVYAVHHPSAGSEIELSKPAGWTAEGAGTRGVGGASTPAHAPKKMPKIVTIADKQAAADWKALGRSTRPYEGQYDVDEFFENYNDGQHFDLESRRWVNNEGRTVENRVFTGKQAKPAAVLKYLTQEGKSFKAFADLLADKGIADATQLEKDIAAMHPSGQKESDIRHALKEKYKGDILDIAKQKRTLAGQRDALETMLANFNNKDRSEMMEGWYRDRLAPQSERHVKVTDDNFTKRNYRFQQDVEDHEIDVMGIDGVAHEVKSTDAKLRPEEIEQMEDYDRMVRGELEVDVTAPGKPTVKGVTVNEVRYTFTSEAGARANREVMRAALVDYGGRVTFEVIVAGESKPVVIDSVAKLNKVLP